MATSSRPTYCMNLRSHTPLGRPLETRNAPIINRLKIVNGLGMLFLTSRRLGLTRPFVPLPNRISPAVSHLAGAPELHNPDTRHNCLVLIDTNNQLEAQVDTSAFDITGLPGFEGTITFPTCDLHSPYPVFRSLCTWCRCSSPPVKWPLAQILSRAHTIQRTLTSF